MAVKTGSPQEPSKEQEEDIALSRTPTTDVDQAHYSSFWSGLFPDYLWPRVVHAPPKVHLSISTSTRSFSLSSPDPLKVSLTLTLQPPSPPITLFVKGTIFERNLSYYPVYRDFNFVDITSGEEFEPGDICLYLYNIPDLRQNELSYRNSDLFMTLYPSVPHIVERLVKPCTTDHIPMKSGHEYRIDPCPSSKSTSTWWDYGRKWHILKWTSWPFGRPQYASIYWGDKGRDRPGPFEIKCIETCLIKVVD